LGREADRILHYKQPRAYQDLPERSWPAFLMALPPCEADSTWPSNDSEDYRISRLRYVAPVVVSEIGPKDSVTLDIGCSKRPSTGVVVHKVSPSVATLLYLCSGPVLFCFQNKTIIRYTISMKRAYAWRVVMAGGYRWHVRHRYRLLVVLTLRVAEADPGSWRCPVSRWRGLLTPRHYFGAPGVLVTVGQGAS
jgi:hypothetical protein